MNQWISTNNWPLWQVVLLFVGATLIIAFVGPRLTRYAARLAEVTGLGQAVFGGVLLGGSTSLPGIVTSVTAAYEGYAELAISNAAGGIAVQTAFLAIADMAYRQANLEHAAASIENLMQGALLSTLLSIPLLAMAGPQIHVFGIHPASVLIILAYGFGIKLVSQAHAVPLWRPQLTRETREDKPKQKPHLTLQQLVHLWLKFIVFALLVAGAGYLVANTGITLAERTGLSETVVGGLLTAIATSIPELVTAVAAVRQGALTLAVGDIIGGNTFDVLFISFADISYRQGSIYEAMTNRQAFIIALTILLTGILMLGLLRREKSGFANIGFESVLVIVVYIGGFIIIAFAD